MSSIQNFMQSRVGGHYPSAMLYASAINGEYNLYCRSLIMLRDLIWV